MRHPTFRDKATNHRADRLALIFEAQRRPAPDVAFLASWAVGTVLPEGRATTLANVDAVYSPPEVDRELEAFDVGMNVHAAAKQLRKALERTLERYLATSRRVAVLTGGGLDSGGLLALVSAWAARHGREYFAVAMDFEGGGDGPYLRQLESKLGCHSVRVTPEEGATFEWALERGVDYGPLIWPTAAMELAAYARAREEGADCVLTGVGGDHLFDGNPRSLAVLIRKGRLMTAWRSVHRLRGFHRPRRPAWTWLARPVFSEALPKPLRARTARHAPVPRVPWAGTTMRACLDDERRRRQRDVRDWIMGDADRVSNLDLVFARHRQQVELATGMIRADPFLDRSFQAFVARIPPHFHLVGDVRRGLFREALHDLLPTGLYRRLDKGDFEPGLVRFVAALGGLERLRSLADVTTLASFGIVEPAPFRAEFERFVANPEEGTYWPKVWPVLMMEAFSRAHFGSPR